MCNEQWKQLITFDRLLLIHLTDIADRIFWFIVVYTLYYGYALAINTGIIHTHT